jgi:AAA family ATP:ADP antiporter
MIAFQTAGKATRDALFLSSYPVEVLPTMVIVAAMTAVGLALVTSKLLARAGPARTVPLAFLVSAALLLLEWAFARSQRRPIAVVLYLHYAGLGAVLISGFWSVINERFDPRTAKRYLGRVAAGGTAGGVAGGLLTVLIAGRLPVDAMFPLLAAMHVGCAGLVWMLRPRERAAAAPPVPDRRSGIRIIAGLPYLRTLVVLVILTTVSEGLLDYVFKARATASVGGGEALLRLFAWFYTVIGLIAVALQAGLARRALQHLGLARTVGALPASVVAGGAGALLVPGLAPVLVARGIEAVVRNGFYRPGYELLFAPLPPGEKRATKALVDVGVVRLGDVLGGLLVQVVLLGAAGAGTVLLGGAIAFSLAAAGVAFGLQRGYAQALERNLIARAGQLDLRDARDIATRTAFLHTAGAVGVTLGGLDPVEQPAGDDVGASSPPEPLVASAAPHDPELARLAQLRSRNATTVRDALVAGPVSREVASQVVTLLAWDDVARDAITALRAGAPRFVGLLCDHLLDGDEEFAVRRRLPLVLAACPSRRAVEGLLGGLGDRRFEVRYRCGRALTRLLELDATLGVDQDAVRRAVLREVAVDRGVWKTHRLLDESEDDAWSPVADELIRDRASRSLEHVFTMLALIFPRRPLRIAFHGLHSGDAHLRGTALEYLEAILPDDLRTALWPFLEDDRRAAPPPRPADTVLRDLLASHASIAVDLKRLRRPGSD